jgi:hypothetical protein
LKVSSPVGEFPFELRKLSLNGRRLRIDGAMGAWPAHVEIEPKDLKSLVRVLPAPAIVAGGALAALVAARALGRRG